MSVLNPSTLHTLNGPRVLQGTHAATATQRSRGSRARAPHLRHDEDTAFLSVFPLFSV